MCMYVCMYVCLSLIDSETAGRISMKFGTHVPLTPGSVLHPKPNQTNHFTIGPYPDTMDPTYRMSCIFAETVQPGLMVIKSRYFNNDCQTCKKVLLENLTRSYGDKS